MRENRETRTLRTWALSRENFWGREKLLRSREECGRLREIRQQGQGGDKRNRHSPQLPGCSSVSTTHMTFPLSQGASCWGLSGTAVTRQALGTKAGRAALGRGLSAAAPRVPGRYSTVRCGGENGSLPQQVISLSSPSFLSHLPQLPPVSIHQDPCWEGTQFSIFSASGEIRNL